MEAETTTPKKPIHSLILDTGPLIKNTVAISTLINSAEELYTTPAIMSEIRDEATRSRVQTTLVPFLKIRNPSPASYDAVIAFSKKTGDYSVLSRQDLGILALAYEVHCERNQGDFGLREAPKQPVKRRPGEVAPVSEQKKTNDIVAEADQSPADDGWEQPKGKRAVKGKAIKFTKGQAWMANEEKEEQTADAQQSADNAADGGVPLESENALDSQSQPTAEVTTQNQDTETHLPVQEPGSATEPAPESSQQESQSELQQDLADLTISGQDEDESAEVDLSDDDSDGDWITPSNLSEHQAKDGGIESSAKTTTPIQLDVATMTIDFAMQNVLLQMNLKLLSTNLQRIKKLTSKVLRCHACFNIVKQMDKQFCPRCGQATLQRVSCSTNAKGEFRIHLARNYQWNKRGDRFSVPKPIAGTANTKWSGQGGGQGGWGRDLILAEDQKEYQRQVDQDKRNKTRDLMDEDYLPGILTGDRGRSGGRPKVGGGKNINSKKRF